MAKFVNYRRIVLYQRRSAWVADLGAGKCLAPDFSVNEEYFNSGAGTRKAISRTRQLVIPVFDETTIEHLRIMHMEGCEVRCIAVGDAQIIFWDLDSEFNLTDFGGQLGGFSGVNISLHNDIVWGAVYQAKDLLSGIPWECQSAVNEDGTYYFTGPSGFTGSRWVVGSDNTVDGAGVMSGTGDPEIEIHLPLEGATFSLDGNFIGQIETLDFSGATLTTTVKNTPSAESAVIDDGTWKVKITVNSASSRPELRITDPGSIVSPRVGGCIDCSNLTATLSTAPSWTS